MSSNKEHVSANEVIEAALTEVGVGLYHVFFLCAISVSLIVEAQQVFLAMFIRGKLEKEGDASAEQATFLLSTFFFGMGVGAVVFGWLSDTYGRKRSLLLCLGFRSLFGLAIALTSDNALTLSMTLVGFGCGGQFIMLALLMELLPASKREAWCSVYYSMWTWGSLVQVVVVYWLREATWRFTAAVVVAPLPVVFIAAVVAFPESPRYLVIRERKEDIIKLVTAIAKVNGKPIPKAILELTNTRSKLEGSTDEDLTEIGITHKSSSSGMFTSLVSQLGEVLHPRVRALTLSMWLIWAGVSMSYYGVIMLTNSVFLKMNATTSPEGGGDESQSSSGFFAAFVAAAGELPAYPLLKWVTEKFGRKRPIIYLPMVAALLLISFYLSLNLHSSFLVEVMLVVLIRLLTLLVFDIAYLIGPEAFPTSIRTTATGTCSAAARATTMLTPYVVYPLQDFHPAAPYIVFVCSLLAVSIGGKNIPFDTTGKVLNDEVPGVQGTKGHERREE